MAKQTQGSLILVGMIAGGVGFTSFVAMLVMGSLGFSAALVLSGFVAAGVAVFLFAAFHGPGPEPVDIAVLRPRDDFLVPSSNRSDRSRTDASAPPQPMPAAGLARKGTPAVSTGGGDAATVPGAEGYDDRRDAAGTPEALAPGATHDPDELAGGMDTDGAPTPSGGSEADRTAAEHDASAPDTDSGSTGGDATGTDGSTTTGTDDGAGQSVIGRKPDTLDGPRNGQVDDLKRIKGVGPKLEEMLQGMGFWHYDQIAAWNDHEVAWVDEHLEGFKGRVTRDNWVSQAKTLADGGSTDFSDRADDGEVYD